MVELVSNNLAQYSSLQFSSSNESANSVIEGKAHRIDDDLYQYWITVQPTNPGADIQALSASAYVRLPEIFTVAAKSDAVVFFLNHQLNNGLVRLADASCLQRTSARIIRSNQQLQFTLPPDSLQSAAWSAADSWQLYPELDIYYAVAASDTRAARALSQHIEQLPKRCSASLRRGLEGAALRRWMQELTAIIEHWEPAIDWQTIRVKNIY